MRGEVLQFTICLIAMNFNDKIHRLLYLWIHIIIQVGRCFTVYLLILTNTNEKKSLTDKPPLYDIHHIYIIDLPEKKRTNI